LPIDDVRVAARRLGELGETDAAAVDDAPRVVLLEREVSVDRHRPRLALDLRLVLTAQVIRVQRVLHLEPVEVKRLHLSLDREVGLDAFEDPALQVLERFLRVEVGQSALL
jgi:hypothetical protein